jgi:hypothetical protein
VSHTTLMHVLYSHTRRVHGDMQHTVENMYIEVFVLSQAVLTVIISSFNTDMQSRP